MCFRWLRNQCKALKSARAASKIAAPCSAGRPFHSTNRPAGSTRSPRDWSASFAPTAHHGVSHDALHGGKPERAPGPRESTPAHRPGGHRRGVREQTGRRTLEDAFIALSGNSIREVEATAACA
jgi:hypothetical protein